VCQAGAWQSDEANLTSLPQESYRFEGGSFPTLTHLLEADSIVTLWHSQMGVLHRAEKILTNTQLLRGIQIMPSTNPVAVAI
jgi:hypothetical protein